MLSQTGILEHPSILAHCLYPTDEDIRLLSQRPCGMAHAPKTYLKLAMGLAPLAKFRQAGVAVGLATDGAVSSNTLDILEQMRLAALAQKDGARSSTAQPVAETLDLAFHGGARVMQMGNDLGEIAPGKLADLVLIRQDGLHVFPRFDPAANMVFSSRPSDVHTVICDGKVLLQDGRLLTIDKGQVKREVTARLERPSKEGTLTRGYVVEGKAKATGASTPIQNGVFRVSVSAFSPAVDGVGQKAGVWYVQGTWKIVDDNATKKEKEARYSPVSLKGAIRAELPFNPAVSLGTVTAIVDIPSSPVAGRWTRGAGNFLGNEKFEGVMQIEATLWPDVAAMKGVAK